MTSPLDQRPEMIDRIKLRWWLYALVPILLVVLAAWQGFIPLAMLALVVFALVFWLISFIAALFVLLSGRRRRDRLNK